MIVRAQHFFPRRRSRHIRCHRLPSMASTVRAVNSREISTTAILGTTPHVIIYSSCSSDNFNWFFFGRPFGISAALFANFQLLFYLMIDSFDQEHSDGLKLHWWWSPIILDKILSMRFQERSSRRREQDAEMLSEATRAAVTNASFVSHNFN